MRGLLLATVALGAMSIPAAAGIDCGAPIAGADALTAPVVLLGETHGTREIPEAFARLVCATAAARPGKTILVGLEIPASGQDLIDALVKGAGGPDAKKALLAQEFWQREYQDGRSSEAMLHLLDELRRFKGAGLAIEVRAMDPPGSPGQDERDAKMAGTILAAIESVNPAQTLVLCGDVHSRVQKGFPWDHAASYVPLGARLAAKHGTIGLNTSVASGTAWVCVTPKAEECGPKKALARGATGVLPRFGLDAAAAATSGWSGSLFMQEVSASPPARQAGPGTSH
ncbi:MAG TPA: hypothetical protein VE404_07445 [Verrucomicrobiae bacterium]|nr:hypothetical protein [Verrucomicrobiae bacterium]